MGTSPRNCKFAPLSRNSKEWKSSKLKVSRELQLPRNGRFVRRGEDWNRGTRHAVELVETDDIGMVENVERLNDEVELSVLPNLQEFQRAQIKLHLTVSSQGVPAKPKGTRRQRKCAATVRIEASQRIDGPAASDYQNRSRFHVAEQLGDHPRGLLALFLVSERQVESPAEYEPMPLIVGRQSPLGMERVRVFWLFVEVGSVVNGLGKSVAAGKRHLIRESSIQGQRQPAINRTGVVLPLINAIELRRESRGRKHKPPNLLRKGIWNPEAGSVVGRE